MKIRSRTSRWGWALAATPLGLLAFNFLSFGLDLSLDGSRIGIRWFM